MNDERRLSRQEQRGIRRAAKADLVYVNNFDKGYSRRRCGKGFSYLSTRGKTIRSDRTRKRIKALAIPPGWQDVWICPKSNGHIQAIGRDSAGRRQYIYHERWKTVSAALKYDRMSLMARVLPRIRRRVRTDLSRKRLSRRRVLATVVRLIDRVGIRVGSRVYTEAHGTRGVTTLGPEHVDVDGLTVSLSFPGKSGTQREIDIHDRKLAKVIDHCEEICGQFLFCYRDDEGRFRPVDSTDVNEYLNEVAKEPVTAKGFRTWSGSVSALAILAGEPLPARAATRRRRISAAVTETARMLGNTAAVCRRSYIHPAILAAAQSGELTALLDAVLPLRSRDRIDELTLDECLFAALLPRL